MESSGRLEYFVLVYDAATREVVSFTGHGHDYVDAVLTLTRWYGRRRGWPALAVQLYSAPSFARLLERGAERFASLRFPAADRP